jgi:hypothetical protein
MFQEDENYCASLYKEDIDYLSEKIYIVEKEGLMMFYVKKEDDLYLIQGIELNEQLMDMLHQMSDNEVDEYLLSIIHKESGLTMFSNEYNHVVKKVAEDERQKNILWEKKEKHLNGKPCIERLKSHAFDAMVNDFKNMLRINYHN